MTERETIRNILALALCLLIVVGPVFGPGVSAVEDPDRPEQTGCIPGQPQSATTDPEAFDVNATVNRTNQTGGYRITFTDIENRSRFTIENPDGATFERSHGFKTDQFGALWDKETARPWIELQANTTEIGLPYPSSNDTVLGPVPENDRYSIHYEPESDGYIGAKMLLLGDYTTHATRSGCQEIRLVIPSDANPKDSTEDLLSMYEDASEQIRLGHRYDTVTVFVAPNESQFGLTAGAGDRGLAAEAFVTAGSSTQSASNPWVHEYVHTRQHASSPAWFREGMATYFTARFSLESGRISPRTYDWFLYQLRNSPNGSVSSKSDDAREYTHGALWFVALEQRTPNQSVSHVVRDLPQRQSIHRHELNHTIQNNASGQLPVYPVGEPPEVEYVMGPDASVGPIRGLLAAIENPWIRFYAFLIGAYFAYDLYSNRQDRDESSEDVESQQGDNVSPETMAGR